MELISSAQNPKVRYWRSLQTSKGRKTAGCFLAEGRTMVAEAIASSFPLRAVLWEEGTPMPEGIPDDVPLYQLSAAAFASVAETVTPQGVVAVVEQRAVSPRGQLVLVLDGVQDPGNVGTLIRTAECAGFHQVLFSPQCADPFSPKTLRSTMGSIFRMHLRRCTDLTEVLAEMQSNGYHVVGGHLQGTPFFSYIPADDRICLVIGSEGNGISAGVNALLTHRLRLPMAGGAESLNAAVAGSIMMYHLAHQVLPGF